MGHGRSIWTFRGRRWKQSSGMLISTKFWFSEFDWGWSSDSSFHRFYTLDKKLASLFFLLHTHAHARTRTRAHAHTHTHARARTHTPANAHTHTRTYPHTLRTRTHTHTRTRTHNTRTHPHTHAHTHAHARTHTHTHTRTHTASHLIDKGPYVWSVLRQMAQSVPEAISFDLCSVSLLLGKREITGG